MVGSENPDYNIASCPDDSGRFVIDVDGDEGAANLVTLEAEHGSLPNTYEVRTPRGGRHLWFRGRQPSSAGKLAPKIDVRGSGGYALLPGSVINGRPYETINNHPVADGPEWLDPLLAAAPPRESVTEVELDLPHNVAHARNYVRNHLVKYGIVAVQGEHGDDRTFQEAACEVRGCGLTYDTVLKIMVEDYDPHCDPPWGEDGMATKVTSAFKSCRDKGYPDWTPPPEESFAHFIEQAKAGEFTADWEKAEEVVPARRFSKADFIRNDRGIVRDSQHNICLALILMGVEFRHDVFRDRLLIAGLNGKREQHLDDRAMSDMWLHIDREYKFRPAKEFFWTVIEALARMKPFHPVRDYLNSLKWDGIPRLDKWLATYGGAEDTPYPVPLAQSCSWPQSAGSASRAVSSMKCWSSKASKAPTSPQRSGP